MEEELSIFPEHMSLSQVFNGIHVAQSSFLCCLLKIIVCLFVLFLKVIVLYVIRLTDLTILFGIFKPFYLTLMVTGDNQ